MSAQRDILARRQGAKAFALRTKEKTITLYFPVKRLVVMPLRACHSVSLFPSAVCDDQACLSANARWGRALCGVAQAAPPRLHNALQPGAAGACPTSASGPEPSSPWAAPAGAPRHTSRWRQPPGPVRATDADWLEHRQTAVLLPTAVWPSRGALPRTTARDRRPADERPSTVAPCARGAAHQSAGHGSARG
jgi:hypothetical protein